MIPMLSCWWANRRLDRFLDADPAAPLSPVEAERLEQHLAVCSRCAGSLADRERLRAGLHHLTAHQSPDPAVVRRLADLTSRLGSGEGT